MAALAQRHGPAFQPLDEAEQLLHVATALEGHADNIAPTIFGGVVASAGGHAVRVPLPVRAGRGGVGALRPPRRPTSPGPRSARPSPSPTRCSTWAGPRSWWPPWLPGDIHALRTATEDRLHQDQRFALSPISRTALEVALEAGAWCGWLSGSGPTIATLCAPDEAEDLAAALPEEGHTKMLAIDLAGAVIER